MMDGWREGGREGGREGEIKGHFCNVNSGTYVTLGHFCHVP